MTPSLLSPAEPAVRVRVALPVPVDRVFDYTATGSAARQAAPGVRCSVPFGGRELVGVITEVVDGGSDADGLKAVSEILDPEPAIGPDLLRVLE